MSSYLIDHVRASKAASKAFFLLQKREAKNKQNEQVLPSAPLQSPNLTPKRFSRVCSGFPRLLRLSPLIKKAQHYANMLFAFAQQYAKRRARISSFYVILKFPNVVIRKAP